MTLWKEFLQRRKYCVKCDINTSLLLLVDDCLLYAVSQTDLTNNSFISSVYSYGNYKQSSYEQLQKREEILGWELRNLGDLRDKICAE